MFDFEVFLKFTFIFTGFLLFGILFTELRQVGAGFICFYL